MRVVQVHPGAARSAQDGSRRFTPHGYTFDTRANMLTWEISDDWDEEVQAQHHAANRHIRERLLGEHGVLGGDQKIANFAALGSAPWSVVALHNAYVEEVRDAFTATHYYPALLGACGLGERILNQLVLTLREDYGDHPATTAIAGKNSFDNWTVCIRTLQEWGVFDEEVARDYKSLMKRRHGAVHYRPHLDNGDARGSALEAIHLLQRLVERIFSPIGERPFYFTGPMSRSYVKREAEDWPFVKRFILPSCVLVSPRCRLVPNPMEPGGFDIYDDPHFGVGVTELSDQEFADPTRAHPVEYPF